MAIVEFSEENLVDVVVDSWSKTPDDRLREVMTSFTRHLHAFVREVEPTSDEWRRGIDFLGQIGQRTGDHGFMILSDAMGVSSLVDAINNRKPAGATESSVLGPVYVPGAPAYELGADISLNHEGEPCVVAGTVRDTDGNPVSGAQIDVWQADDQGRYDTWAPDALPKFNLRGLFTTDEDGRYWFRSVVPHSYGGLVEPPVNDLLEATGRPVIRPAHIHLIAGAAGYQPLTTQVYIEGDPDLDNDFAFGVKPSLVRPVLDIQDAGRAAEFGVEAPFRLIDFDIVLARVATA
ncbi:dioxygenase [Kutzneria sp. NPDC051319]|uniref:dioxygenase family protein n=1 Tax=Kutzneria sp. NPDC051319 TaxID=3155047 RepID=UPI003413D691